MAVNTDPNESMSLNDMRKVLLFFMSKLSSADLEELDAQLLGEEVPMASDSRFGDANNRVKFLRLGPKVRQTLRDSLRQKGAQDGRTFDEMFPGLDRLRG